MSIHVKSIRFTTTAVIALFVVAILTVGGFAFDLTGPWGNTTRAQATSSYLAGPLVLPIGVCDTAGAIEIESTGGTTTPTAYLTLNDAFLAVIAGTHTGGINIEVCGNTTETASATLTASGVGSASYSSVTIRPVGGPRIVEGSIVGAIVRLNGADNVTIDGRLGGTGTSRDLTVRNNSTAAATAAMWLSSVAAGNGASNNVVRNLELAGGTDTTASGNATFGILMSGTTISTTANGVDNDNNSFIANRIVKVRYGIVTRGTTTDLNINPVVTDNTIGPTAFGTDQIGKVGIFMQADTGANVSRNTVQFVGCLDPQTCTGADRVGIGIGSESWSAAPGTLTSNNYTVTRNIIHDVVEELTFSAVGINLGTTGGGSATNNLVANNFIYNVRANGTGGDQAVGLGIAGGLGDRVVFNSVSMTGDVDPGVTAASTNYGSGIRVGVNTGATHGNLTLMNNSVYIDLSSSSTAANRYYAISGSVAAYNWGTGGENYNNYFINPANSQVQTGGLGTVAGNALTTQFAALANWQTAYTTPSAQDANSIQADPLYVSPTADLHIAVASPNVNAGTAIVGVVRDIDNQSRVGTPDIGADELSGITPPANDLEATAILVPANGAIFTVGATTTPQARYTNVGTATQTNVSVQFTVTGPGGYTYSNSQLISNIDPDQTVTVTFAATPAFTTAGSYTMTAIVATPDSNTTNDSVTGNFSVVAPVGGSVNVGTGETYTSLTNAGGIFAAINAAGAAGNITINITSDLTGETGGILLNEIAGGVTVTIQPSGAPRTISGNSGAGGLLGFNGTDGVTIDGSLSGGNDRSLTIQPTNSTNAGGGIYFASGAAGAQNNVVRNVNVFGNGSITGILLGVAFGGNAFGAIGLDNDNNRVENCDVRGAFYGIASLGASAANKNTGTVITRNVMPNAGAAGIGRVGIYVIFEDGVQITQNNVASVSNPGSVDTIGIAAGSQALANTPLTTGGVSNAVVSRNYIGVVSNIATFSAAGIVVASDATGTNNIANNMVTGVTGNSNSGDIVAGIYVNGLAGSTQNVYHNSVSMTGDRLPVTANMFPSYALVIATDQPVNVVNNALFNSQTRTGSTGVGGESYAIGFDGPAANVNLTSNFNDLLVSGPLGQVGITGDLTTAAQTTTPGVGTNQPTLLAWQAATTEDANSISLDPLWVSTTDLHIPAGSPLVNAGTDVSVTTDFDGQARDAQRDIGADEFVVLVPGTLEFSSATYTVNENVAGGTVTLTVTRSGGTDGAVSVDYALTNGTATGGASCGAGIDYVNTGGTVSFANGESSKTFNVGICDDAVFEGNETFTSTLSNPTGGATLGGQLAALTTIVDNEIAAPGTIQFSSAAYSVGEAGPVATITATRNTGSDGVVSADYATVAGGTAAGGATCTPGTDYLTTSGTVTFAEGSSTPQTFDVPICQDMTVEGNETVNLALSNPQGGATLGTPSTAVLTINEDDVPLSGTINVGTGQAYESLTNAGGLFEAINNLGASGPLTINITSNLSGETGTVALNEIVGGHAVLIRPFMVAPLLGSTTFTITGSSTSGIIKLNGADNITIDGSLTGGTAGDTVGGDPLFRNLTVQNTSTTATTGAVVVISAATGGAQNNTIKNTNVIGQDPAQTQIGIAIGGATAGTLGSNDNTRIENCSFRRTTIGIYNAGASAGDQSAGGVVTKNDLAGTAAERIRRTGMLFFFNDNLTVSLNSVGGISSDEPVDVIGIGLGSQLVSATSTTGGGVTNSTVTRNRINGVASTNSLGLSAVGITVGGGTTGSNIISNNMVSGVTAPATSPDIVAGVFVAGTTGSDTRLYHNSVSLTGERGAAGSQIGSYGIAITGASPVVELKNNIFYNTQTSGGGVNARTYSIGMVASTFTNFNSNFNDFFASGANSSFFRTGSLATTGGTQYATLALFSAATLSDSSSQEVDPLFINTANDLHLQPLSPVGNDGTPITAVTVDFDGEARSATTPDIGADEIATPAQPGSLQFSSPTYVGDEDSSPFIVTVTRTGGTNGAVSVNFATSNGTATGGASCAAGIDYVSTSGTLNFADGVSNHTFNLTICNDVFAESDETINYALTNATGGATIGTPGSAVQTIIDDDPAAGSISVGDARLFEGKAGTVNATFTVTHTGSGFASVDFATTNGTAIAGIDYVSETGTLIFNAPTISESGIPTQQLTVTVAVNGDTNREANETFFLNLSNPANATIGDGQGAGIIVDDDRPYTADFDDDRISDFSVYRPADNRFYVRNSSDGTATVVDMGTAGDIPVPGDYNADGETDYALWRPSTAEWFVRLSGTPVVQTTVWGIVGDKPAQGDYDGDGRTDLAIYRPSTGQWWVRRSSDATSFVVSFGISTDEPVQSDFDGDFKTDIAVYRGGVWYILQSSNGSVRIQNWGLATDRPLAGDFDGDGSSDLAVFRNGDWWIFRSLTGTATSLPWGVSTDIPAPADFDGDGSTDLVVFRPSTGDWYVRRSSNNTTDGLNWGLAGDIPVPSRVIYDEGSSLIP